MDDSILVHFHPEERIFVQRVQEWIDKAAFRHESKRTDFLDPRQCQIVQSLVNREMDVHVTWFGGYDDAERKVGWITPEYAIPTQSQSGLCAISIEGDTRFVDVDHGDFLGAILGLGIKRDKVGDILVHDNGCHLIVVEEIADYISAHLGQVHRISVQVTKLEWTELQIPKQSLEELQFTVASARLDAILGDVYRLSRAKALQPIQAGRVKVNWKPQSDPSFPLKAGDVVSTKGFGRFQVLEVEGPTKKGRLRIRVGKYT
jgi:RNA-binding protein YlmH